MSSPRRASPNNRKPSPEGNQAKASSPKLKVGKNGKFLPTPVPPRGRASDRDAEEQERIAKYRESEEFRLEGENKVKQAEQTKHLKDNTIRCGKCKSRATSVLCAQGLCKAK